MADGEGDFIAFERANNPLLQALSAPKGGCGDLAAVAASRKGFVLVPQSVTLDGAVSRRFAEAHVVLPSPDPTGGVFVTLAGVRGEVRTLQREAQIVVALGDAPVATKTLHERCGGIAQGLFSGGASPEDKQEGPIVLRSTSATTESGLVFQIMIISEPFAPNVEHDADLAAAVLQYYDQLFHPATSSLFQPLESAGPVAAPATSAADVAVVGVPIPRPATTSSLNYKGFLEKMKRIPSGDPIPHSIRVFLREFKESKPSDDDGRKVQDFLAEVQDRIAEYPLWANATDDEMDNTVEGLEKYMITKLFDRVYAPHREADFARDAVLRGRIEKLSWIRFEHLDIDKTYYNDVSLQFAQKELLKMQNYKVPRDKLICLLNCCKVIAKLIHVTQGPGGADEFLPLLIWVVLKANPEHLHSDMAFIQDYRNPQKMMSETGYYFTNLVSAVTFIENLDASSLCIEPAEFDRLMVGENPHMKLLLDMSSPSQSAPESNKSLAVDTSLVDASFLDALAGRPRASSSPMDEFAPDPAAGEPRQTEEEVLRSDALREISEWMAQHPPQQSGMDPAAVIKKKSPMMRTVRLDTEPAAGEEQLPGSFVDVALEDLRVGDLAKLLSEYKVLHAAATKRINS